MYISPYPEVINTFLVLIQVYQLETFLISLVRFLPIQYIEASFLTHDQPREKNPFSSPMHLTVLLTLVSLLHFYRYLILKQIKLSSLLL